MSRSTAFDGGVRVERAEDEEAGLGGVERHPHRLEVAQLADEDRVGVLPERGLQRGREGRRVGAELAVGHDRRLRDVDELDRVLDRDDVVRLRPVDPVDEGGERRRLPRAGRPGDEDEAAERPADGGDLLGEAEVLDGQDARGDHPEDGGGPVLLPEEVHAEAGLVAHRVGEVAVAAPGPLLPDRRGRDRVEEVLEVLLADRPPPQVRRGPRRRGSSAASRRRGGGRRPSSRGRPSGGRRSGAPAPPASGPLMRAPAFPRRRASRTVPSSARGPSRPPRRPSSPRRA